MNMNVVSRLSVAAVCLVSLMGCGGGTGTGTSGAGGGTTGTTGAGGATGTTGAAGTGGAAGTTGATGTGGAEAVTCSSLLTSDLSGWSESYASANPDAAALYSCVCSAGTLCSLACDNPTKPSFCAGMSPIPNGQCEMCIKQTTGANGCADQYNTCMAN
jgi:collagen type VII alpha